MHLDLDNAVTAAGFAASALDIEAEAALAVALRLGIRRRCEQIADQVKYSGIGSRIGSGSTSDGGLVDVDDFVQLLHTFDSLMFTGNATCTVQLSRQMFVKNLIHQ